MQALQPLKADLVMVGQGRHLGLGEDEAGETAEEHWLPVTLLYSDRRGGVGGVVPCQSGWQDRVKGAVVCGDAGEDGRHVGGGGPEDAEVVSLVGGEDGGAAHHQGSDAGGVPDICRQVFWVKNQQLSFCRAMDCVRGGSVFFSQSNQALESLQIVAD